MRVFKAFILAPVLPIFLLIGFDQVWPYFKDTSNTPLACFGNLLIASLIGALIVAYALSLLVAAPVFLILRRY